MFSCVYVCFPLLLGFIYIAAGLSFSSTAKCNGGSLRGIGNKPWRRPVEHPCYPFEEAMLLRRSSPATLHLQCAKSVEGRNPESIPDTNMEKSLFGANIRANIILPERNHGEHL